MVRRSSSGAAEKRLEPQVGPQSLFLSTPADIAIYGGAAGGGKSFGLLLDPLRHVLTVRGFYGVFFRRTTTQIRNPGGLWDESQAMYMPLGAKARQHELEYMWPAVGSKLKLAHLEHEMSVYDWQGAQVPFIGFDELTHFTRAQFFYMLSRNRSTCGVRPYVRATTNPDAESWVAELIDWWIDPQTGLPIDDRAGVLRWFARKDDVIEWGDSRDELIDRLGSDCLPKTLTFIPAQVYDNPALLANDPGYLANLQALPYVERMRLLGGNWKIRPSAGLYFRRDWVNVIDVAPANMDVVRYWDLAATDKTQDNDPDWTVGVKLGKYRDTNRWCVLHVCRLRGSPAKVEEAIRNIAAQDGARVRIGLPQDPGQAGKAQARYMIGSLAGFAVTARAERGDKITRFGPFSAQCEAGNIDYVRGPWLDEHFNALEGFPDALHDDDADASGGALGMFLDSRMGFLDYFGSVVAEKRAREEAAQAQGNVVRIR
ncbi:phage terminase large subunit [Burkholderia stagnalis]|uniref:phage terminase large subunit n=1 Tax=Burkholderia stagnalis TaxID=1503054 RepID=UPI000F7FCBAA|nr:phage terminase large subunit [Burkholderia stagnalis]